MFKKISKIILLFLFIGNYNLLYSIFPINLFKIYDVNLYRQRTNNARLETAFLVEGSLSIRGRNAKAQKVNVLQIWNKTLDALTMIRGLPFNKEARRLSNILNAVNDNKIRGNLIPTGDLHASGYTCYAQYFFPHNFSVNLFLPFFSMKLKNVQFTDLTKNITIEDQLVREHLTKDFRTLIRNLGGPEIKDWERTGLGDLYGFVQWTRNYRQNKPWLKNVYVDTRFGLTVPTGLKSDINQLFSIPFGFDGAWGIFVGGGIELTWGHCFQAGVDLQFLQLFSHAAERRIKTHRNQSELVLLAKTKALKEFGIMQIFNVYLQANRIFRGFSFRADYEFMRHDDDKLWLFNNDYSSTMANTSIGLLGWTIHQFVFDFSYDFCVDLPNSCVVPKISLYYKVPFNGRRSVTAQTLSLDLSISF